MKKVLVTGVSGYIGQHCAAELLRQGYSVRGSLRQLSKSQELLNGFRNAGVPTTNLSFCKLDLLDDVGWGDAMKDCEYLMHVASPFITQEPKDENKLIIPALEGTKRALQAAFKSKISRIVLTSSMVTMLGDAYGSLNIDQNTWTDLHSKNISAYVKSKTLAERFAWEAVKNQNENNKLGMVVINPGPVFGPTLSGNLSGESMSMFRKLITGKIPMQPQASINMSDVRDVAVIHVKALQIEKAIGQRFIVSTEKPYSFLDLAKILKCNGYNRVNTKIAPTVLLKTMMRFNAGLKGMRPFVGNTFHGDVSNTIRVFDWHPIPFKKTVLDTALSVEKAMKS